MYFWIFLVLKQEIAFLAPEKVNASFINIDAHALFWSNLFIGGYDLNQTVFLSANAIGCHIQIKRYDKESIKIIFLLLSFIDQRIIHDITLITNSVHHLYSLDWIYVFCKDIFNRMFFWNYYYKCIFLASLFLKVILQTLSFVSYT